MRTFDRSTLTITLSAALLVGCGGSQLPSAANIMSAGTQARSHHSTFKYTGGEQSFKVPAGVTHVRILATGGDGARGGPPNFASGAGGSAVTLGATISVRPGERLAIFVGGSGRSRGFNGGGGRGSGCPSGRCYGWGGGASDVRQRGDKLADRVVVGGGGGGGGTSGCAHYSSCSGYYGAGGSGGRGGGNQRGVGGSGDNGSGEVAGSGGTGGTHSRGGKGGAGGGSGCGGGSDGSLGAGGVGGNGLNCSGIGGSGGGGYYGGGGGGAGGAYGNSGRSGGGGGGGGSSFAVSSATNVQISPGSNKGDGTIEISW